MNKLALVAVTAVLGVGAYSLYQNFIPPEATMQKEEVMKPKEDKSMESKQEVMVKKDDTMMENKTKNSSYLEYTKAALDGGTSGRRVLFFYASWCPTCKPADDDFKKNISKIPEDVTVIRVNYNDPETDKEEKELAKKYGVTYQHTFVQIDDDGRVVAKWNGGKTDELLSNIK